ncbi:MAG: DNA recombination protein RmuC [bacterium]|nr:DNA recombination protein RmuC [bacterium]
METTFGIIIGFLIAGFIAYIVLRGRGTRKDTAGESLSLIQGEIHNLRDTLERRLHESHSGMQKQYDDQVGQSMKMVREVTERLTTLDETNKQVISFTDQLQSLQDILKNPKQRGVLGEYYLETVLKNVMPPGSFSLQYGFANGDIVDAVIHFPDGKLLTIDSKFSLENYSRVVSATNDAERLQFEKLFRQDLKNRIDETSKYINPNENTMDFAFMFIPSEAIYYDLLINQVGTVKAATQDLIEYAFNNKHVIIVSPTSFMAYLQTVIQGLRSLKIEESAKEIRMRVEQLGMHLTVYNEYFGKVGSTLQTTVNHYNRAGKELKKIDRDVVRITGESPKLDVLEIEKPELE